MEGGFQRENEKEGPVPERGQIRIGPKASARANASPWPTLGEGSWEVLRSGGRHSGLRGMQLREGVKTVVADYSFKKEKGGRAVARRQWQSEICNPFLFQLYIFFLIKMACLNMSHLISFLFSTFYRPRIIRNIFHPSKS